jgi:hypothetical protein
MTRRIALITTLLALVLARPAAAQQNPFGPLPQASTPVPTATPVPTTSTSDGSNTERVTLFAIGGALVIGFLVIGWFIMRDARRAIPKEELAALSRLRDEGPHARKRQAKARARARTRRQKQARKKNRPRP